MDEWDWNAVRVRAFRRIGFRTKPQHGFWWEWDRHVVYSTGIVASKAPKFYKRIVCVGSGEILFAGLKSDVTA